MERQVIFTQDMDIDPQDMTNLQDFTRKSLDHIVADAITAEARYAAFNTVKSGPTTIRTAPGELYSGGQVFVRSAEYTRDFATALPVIGKRYASIVTWGSEVETDERAREFLINAETLESEPRMVAMERARIANIDVVMGTEGPDPAPPLVNAAYTVVAHVLLTPTGVETVTMNKATALPQLGKVDGRLGEVEVWRDRVDPQIATIKTDLAKLANQKSGPGTAMVLRIAADVARLKERSGLPDNRIDYGADHFLSLDETDVENVNLLAKTEEGIRFGPENAGLSQLQVFDNLNPRHVIVGGMLLPAYTRQKRIGHGERTGELSIAQYTYQTHEMRQLSRSRQRIRYGEEFTVCTNAEWWQSGQYDPISGIFTRNGETFEVGHDVNYYGGGSAYHQMMRVRRVFIDTYEEPYWDQVTTDHVVQGAQISWTFLNSQDGWLDAVGLIFTRLADDGAVNIAITETSGGKPDLQRVIGITTVTRDKLKLNEKTLMPIPLTYLMSGRRYGLVVTTNADHYVATCNATGTGTLFLSIDGAYQQGDLTRGLCAEFQFATFASPRVEVDMAPLDLSGGIAAIDILAELIAPASTELTFEVMVNSVWHPLREVNQTVLIGLPPLLKLRCVFLGTNDMMPAVVLSGSQVTVSRPRTVFNHISTPRTLPAPAENIQVQTRLEYFEPDYHSSAVRLLTGSGYATAATPVAVTDIVLPEESAVERTYLFQLPAPVDTYKIEISGTTSSALKTFHVAERIDIALS